MPYGGFEQERKTLKYCCSAQRYGVKCALKLSCPVGKVVRIALKEDRRVFTPVDRSSYKWKSLYKMRTLCSGLIAGLIYRFEKHYMRGLANCKCAWDWLFA